jgi:hypothetical protein
MSESPRTPSPTRDAFEAPGAPARIRQRQATPLMPGAPARMVGRTHVIRNLLAAFEEVESQMREAAEFHAVQDGKE